MINRQALLSDLQALLTRLEADLLDRSESAEVPDVGRTLRAEYERAKQAERTAANYEDWRSDTITQAAAAWVLSCVFVRFLEDNHLIEPPKIAGVTGHSSVVIGHSSLVIGGTASDKGQRTKDAKPATNDQGRVTRDNRLQRARDEHELYFRAHPKLTDRDYLLAVFDELTALPGTKDVFGEHNPIRELPNWLSGDAGGELLRFFQKIDANTGVLVHDFTDPAWDTRFLGDLYQDLSEAARKKYALLQTPEFVEEFILERTLEPALNEFGLVTCHSSLVIGHWSFVIGPETNDKGQMTNDAKPATNDKGQVTNDIFRMIDPACGSGHFLLGSFRRILERWRKKEPKANPRDLIQRTLDSIHGVDVNPYAVAIARFRLLLLAMRAEGINRLADAPAYRIHLVVGDSLMHGRPGGDQLSLGWRDVDHAYHAEDRSVLQQLLAPGRYHAVVANPPYITPKDRALNDEYRRRYPKVCHMKYSLAAPFMQRLFDLACAGGFTGQITANSFMKREFGKKLIENYLPKIDLTHVIDSRCVHLPGHGTSTVILLGRQRAPVAKNVRLVSTLKNEEPKPIVAEHGKVWLAVLAQVDVPGSQSDFVTVSDTSRESLNKHPWSIGGGGAAELKEQLDDHVDQRLSDRADSIGITAFTLEDDIFLIPRQTARRREMRPGDFRVMVVGDAIRDWTQGACDVAVFPYDAAFGPIPDDESHPSLRYLWQARCCLAGNKMFGGKTKVECGLKWYEYGRLTADKLRTPLSIVYGEVATHNHFVLDCGGKVFNRTAPVIKLSADASEDDHLAVLGLLNSSTACFWMRQVCHDKGGGGIGGGIAAETWERRFAFNGTQLQPFPLPADHPRKLARHLDELAGRLSKLSPVELLRTRAAEANRELIAERRVQWEGIRRRMIALQEELDWECYRLYGLIDGEFTCDETPLAIPLGHRAFEFVMARKMAVGELQTTWFARHGSTPITDIPAEWPDDYKRLVERRIELIQTDRNIGLIEQPEYKRRWNTEPWQSQLERALREWLLGRVESYSDFDSRMDDAANPSVKLDIALTSVSRLADVARQDAVFMQIGEVYRYDQAFNVDRLLAELIGAESVPLLPILRYKPSGLRKRAEWEQTWELQREEDRRASLVTGHSSLVTGAETNDQGQMTNDAQPATNDQGQMTIPVPPKYTSADFLKSDYWRLRGKLDVPKERWISFPHCEGPDGTLVIAWAGYDHLQLARSISSYFVDIQERLGGRNDPRLVPLLACLLELIPWLKQWHNEVDPEFGERMGDYFEGFVNEEARQLGKTVPEIKAWEPPKKAGGRKKK